MKIVSSNIFKLKSSIVFLITSITIVFFNSSVIAAPCIVGGPPSSTSSCEYAAEQHIKFDNIDFSNPIHKPFEDTPIIDLNVFSPLLDDGASIGDWVLHDFDSLVDVTVTITIPLPGGGESEFILKDINAPTETKITLVGRGTDASNRNTWTFENIMLAMTFEINESFGSVQYRLDPDSGNESKGITIFTELGGDMYQVDSFFDVFAEISIDGGTTWIKGDGPGRMVAQAAVPEPSSLLLLGLGLLPLAYRRKKKSDMTTN